MEYNFEGLSDIDLAILQHKARQFPEDKEFVNDDGNTM